MLIHPDKKEVVRGRHRGVTRRHRSAHRGDYASLLARMVPSWTLAPGSEGSDRPDRGPRTGTHPGRIPVFGNDLRPSSDAGVRLAVDVRDAGLVTVDDRQPFDVEELDENLFSHAPADAAVRSVPTIEQPAGRPPESATIGLDVPSDLRAPSPAPLWRFEDVLARLRRARPESVVIDTEVEGVAPPRQASLANPVLDEPVLDQPDLDELDLDEPDLDDQDLDQHGHEEHGHDEHGLESPTFDEPELDQPAADEAALDGPEHPIWDPTGRHTTLTPAQPADRRRFSFADMLGFGDDTETFTIDDDVWSASSDTGDSWDSFPTLASVAVDDAPTNQLIERLWHATAEHPITVPADQLAPVDIPEMFRTNRTFRWTVLAGALVVLVVVLFTMRAIGQRPVTIAEERAVEYAAGIDTVGSALIGFESTARTIANPATDTSELGELTGDLLLVGGAARDLAETAAEPLPEPSLLGPSAQIEVLQSPRDLLRQAADAALAVERRLGDAVSYRVLIGQAFDTPELPVAARESELGDIGAQLSVVQVTTERMLAQLPDDPFFATHAAQAASLLTSFETWQVQYLDALRQGDVAGAGILRRDWQNAHSALMADIATPLMAIDEWSSAEIAYARDLLDVAAERLGDEPVES